jgi:hypothetical protein
MRSLVSSAFYKHCICRFEDVKLGPNTDLGFKTRPAGQRTLTAVPKLELKVCCLESGSRDKLDFELHRLVPAK